VNDVVKDLQRSMQEVFLESLTKERDLEASDEGLSMLPVVRFCVDRMSAAKHRVNKSTLKSFIANRNYFFLTKL